MVTNLLDMARLAAGKTKPRKEWQVLEEVAGAAVQLLGRSLAAHRVAIEPAGRIAVDRIRSPCWSSACSATCSRERREVLAAVARESRHARPCADGFVHVSVATKAPAFRPVARKQVFAMFVRGAPESSVTGAGLGLADQPTIVEAHGGAIHAANRPPVARSHFTLPLGSPPAIVEEAETETWEAPHG
jgi:two-component system sensor histidine kinase KdpD